MNLRRPLLLLLTFSFLVSAKAQTGTGGIASRYPSDVGLRNDPDVILFEDFEAPSYSTGLTGTALASAMVGGPAHWSKIPGNAHGAITDISGQFFSGNKAIRLTLPGNVNYEPQITLEKAFTPYTTETWGGRTVGTCVRNTDPAYRTLYIRWYQKWKSDYLVQKANHNGGQFVAGLSGTGQIPPADGSIEYEFLMQNNFQGQADDVFDLAHSPFYTHIYVYAAGRGTDHAFPGGNWRGQTRKTGCTDPYPACGGPIDMWGDVLHWPHFNPPFEPKQRPDFRPNKNQWYCYEFMLTTNTLTGTTPNRDGEIKAWIDGQLIFHFTDLFMMGPHNGLPYYIDRARIDLQCNAFGTTVDAIKYIDNIVIAHSYIGPMVTGAPSPTPTPSATPTPTPVPTPTPTPEPTPSPTPEPTATPTPSATPEPTPTPTPEPTATPSPTPEPTPTPTPEPTPSPAPSPTPEPSPSPSPTPDPSVSPSPSPSQSPRPSATPTATPLPSPSPSPTNLAPIAKAGPDKTIRMPNAVWLYGSASDDALPNPPAKCTFHWSKVSGPGTVYWGTQNSLTSNAGFSRRGIYVLKLTVSDGALSSSDNVTVTVKRRLSTSAPANKPLLPQ